MIEDIISKGLDPTKPHNSLHKGMLKGNESIQLESTPEIVPEIKEQEPIQSKPLLEVPPAVPVEAQTVAPTEVEPITTEPKTPVVEEFVPKTIVSLSEPKVEQKSEKKSAKPKKQKEATKVDVLPVE